MVYQNLAIKFLLTFCGTPNHVVMPNSSTFLLVLKEHYTCHSEMFKMT